MERTPLAIAYDFICPWSWISFRHLKAGARLAGREGRYDARYLAVELNPAMPATGMDRREYSTRKLGSWARSEMIDATVTAAGLAADIPFRFGEIARIPNTRPAHRLMQYALGAGDAEAVERLYDAIFAAHFADGRDIGNLDTLASLAAEQGFDAGAARGYVAAGDGDTALSTARAQASALGMQSPPAIRVGDFVISGAQPPHVFARALQRLAKQTYCRGEDEAQPASGDPGASDNASRS